MHEPAQPTVTRPLWVRSINRLSWILVIPGCVITLLLMFHIVADVVGRTLFNHPLPATSEMVQYWWMVLITFSGFGFTQLRGDHIRATLVTDYLPLSWQKWSEVATLLILAGFAAGLAWYGLVAARHSMEIGEAVMAAFTVPVWPFVFAIPVGGVALVLQCVASMYDVVTRGVHETPSIGIG